MPSKALNFQNKQNIRDRLGIKPNGLIDEILMNKQKYYKHAPEKDAKGKMRDFYKSWGDLKLFQWKLHRTLMQLQIPKEFFGGVSGKSVKLNAKAHQGKNFVMNLDLHNFFPSVESSYIESMFMRLGCSAEIAKDLTELTTASNHLAQGFSSSPAISIFVLAPLILELRRTLPKEFVITVWIDDLTISSNQNPKKYLGQIKKIIKSHGFLLSPKKSKFHLGIRHKTIRRVTGVIINDSNLSPEKGYGTRLYALIKAIEMNGIESAGSFGENFNDLKDAKKKIRNQINWMQECGQKKRSQRLLQALANL